MRISAFRESTTNDPTHEIDPQREKPYKIVAPIGLQHQARALIEEATAIFTPEFLKGARIRVIPSPPAEYGTHHTPANFNKDKEVIHVSISLFSPLLLSMIWPMHTEFLEGAKPLAENLLNSKAIKGLEYYALMTALPRHLEELAEPVPDWVDSPEQYIVDAEFDVVSTLLDIYTEYLLALIPVDKNGVVHIPGEVLSEFYPLVEYIDQNLAKQPSPSHSAEQEVSQEPIPMVLRLMGIIESSNDYAHDTQRRIKSIQHELLHYGVNRLQDPRLKHLLKQLSFDDETLQKMSGELSESTEISEVKKIAPQVELIEMFVEKNVDFFTVINRFSEQSLEDIQAIAKYLSDQQLRIILSGALCTGIEESALALFHHDEEGYLRTIRPYANELFIVLPNSEVVAELQLLVQNAASPEEFVEQLVQTALNPERIDQLVDSLIATHFAVT